MENVDISLLQPSGSVSFGYDSVFVVDVMDIKSRRLLISLDVQGSRLYDLIISVCSNCYMVTVRPVNSKK